MTQFAKRSGIMLAIPFTPERLLNQGRYKFTWTPPFLVQRKLNGERARMLVQDTPNGKRCILLSSSEKLIQGLPHINSAGLSLPQGEYDGELYTHGMAWNEIHARVSRTQKYHEDSHSIQFHIFDLITEYAQWERIRDLIKIFKHINNPALQLVKTSGMATLPKVLELYERYIAEGYEGMIIRAFDAKYERKRRPCLMKFKGKQQDTYKVVDVNEAISESGKGLEMIGSFKCIDDMGTIFNVSAGHLSHDLRKKYWGQLQHFPIPAGLKLVVKYQTLSDKNKIPLFSVADKLIFEEN